MFQEKFWQAMETSQRVVKETATSGEKQMSELLSVATSLFNLLNTTDSVIDTIDLLIQEYKIVDLISTNIIEEDVRYLEKNADEIPNSGRIVISSFRYNLGTQTLHMAESMLQIENHNESKVLRYLKACDATNDTTVVLTDCPGKSYQQNVGIICLGTMTTTGEMLTTDVINCSSILDEAKKNYFSINTKYLGRVIPGTFPKYEDMYLSQVESVYKNMSEILEAIPQHTNCINSIHLLQNITGDLNHLYHLMINTSEVINIEEAISTLHKLLDSCLLWKIKNEDFKILGKDVYSCVKWLREIAKIEEPSIESTFDNFRKGSLEEPRKESYELFMKTMSLDYRLGDLVISQYIKQISAYLEGKITKRRLTANFSGLTFSKALNDIADGVAGNTPYLTEFKKQVGILNLKVAEGLGNLAHFTLPILNRINAKDLPFIKAVKVLDRVEFNAMINSFNEDFRGNFIKLLKMNYDGFVSATEKLLKNISVIINDLTEQVTRLQEDLSKYKTLTDMDVEFYK